MPNKSVHLSAAVAVIFLAALAALGLARRPAAAGAQEPTAVSAVVSPLLQYQARLSDPASGKSVSDGIYTITFRLYAAPSGGQPLWSEVKDVPVQNGLFSVLLGDTTALDQGLFNGGALWLGIKIGADAEAVPRQHMVPVAYALSLVPGAVIEASSSDTATLTLGNSGGGDALAAQGPVSVDGDLTVSGSLVGGAHSHSSYVDWYSFDDHLYGGMHHERYTDAEAVSAIKAGDGSGSGLDADLLDGQQANAFAPANHGHGMLPLAYGSILYDGTKFKASSNVTSAWNPAYRRYEITIAGNPFSMANYIVLVTPWADDEVFVDEEYPTLGKLLIYFDNKSYGSMENFYFMVFKH